MRNPQPFPDRQIRFLETIRKKIRQINDTDPDIIRNESYEFHTEQTKQFGKIPKIRFKPYSGQIKARIVEKASLIDESQNEKKAKIRKKFGIRESRNSKANLFESEWNNIMLKLKKSLFTTAHINQLFTTDRQTISDPIALLQSIVIEEYSQIKAKREPIIGSESSENAEPRKYRRIKPYDQELSELEQLEYVT